MTAKFQLGCILTCNKFGKRLLKSETLRMINDSTHLEVYDALLSASSRPVSSVLAS